MRNMIMCALTFLFMANVSIGQEATIVETVTVKIYDQQNEIISKTIFDDKEATSLDISSLLLKNQDAERITVKGLFYSDKEVNRIHFDSRTAENFSTSENFCEQVEFTLKPFLGVGAYSTDDMRGVSLERIVKSSPADAAGFDVGDIIITFNDMPIGSFCDLKMEISECEVGQVVPVQIENAGEITTEYVTIGGQINNKITYVGCDAVKAELNLASSDEGSFNLSVYPNPTNGDTNMKFLSTSKEEVKFYVLDINGGIIHKELLNDFNGVLSMNYTFVNEAAGNYLFIIEQGDKLYKQQVIYSRK